MCNREHTGARTHRHTHHTQTDIHTETQTHRHRHTDTDTQTQTHTHTHTQTNNFNTQISPTSPTQQKQRYVQCLRYAGMSSSCAPNPDNWTTSSHSPFLSPFARSFCIVLLCSQFALSFCVALSWVFLYRLWRH